MKVIPLADVKNNFSSFVAKSKEFRKMLDKVKKQKGGMSLKNYRVSRKI